MVDFAVLNELSLPLGEYKKIEQLDNFFKLRLELKEKGITNIRTESSIIFGLKGVIGQLTSDKRLYFYTILSKAPFIYPAIFDEEEKKIETYKYEFYADEELAVGLGIAHLLDTIGISFNTDARWNRPFINIEAYILQGDSEIVREHFSLRHCADTSHLVEHNEFFTINKKSLDLNCNNLEEYTFKNYNFKNIEFIEQLASNDNSIQSIFFRDVLDNENRKNYMEFSEISQPRKEKYSEEKFYKDNSDKIIFKYRVTLKIRCWGYVDEGKFTPIYLETNKEITG